MNWIYLWLIAGLAFGTVVRASGESSLRRKRLLSDVIAPPTLIDEHEANTQDTSAFLALEELFARDLQMSMVVGPDCDPDCPCCDEEDWPEFVAAVETFASGDECYAREDSDGSNIVALLTCEPTRNVAYMSYDFSGTYPTVPYCGDSRSARNFLTDDQGAACEALIQTKVDQAGATCTDEFPECDEPPPDCSPTTGSCVDNFEDLQSVASNAQPNDVIALCGGTIMTESAIVIDQPNIKLCCLENEQCIMQSRGTDRNLIVVGESFTLLRVDFYDGSDQQEPPPVPIDINAGGGNVVIDANGDHSILSCNFYNGSASSFNYGGNLFVKTADSVTLEFSLFDGGLASFAGGVAVWNAVKVSVFECEFRDNIQEGLFSGNLDLELRDPGQDITLERSIFFNNSGSFGGGFLASGIGILPKLSVFDCDFTSNVASADGGAGAVVPDSGDLDLRLLDNTGSGNVAENGECDDFLIFLGIEPVCYDVSDEIS